MNYKDAWNDVIIKEMDSVPVIMCLVDIHGKVFVVNGDTEKTLNITKEEMLQTYLKDWIDTMSLEKMDVLRMTADADEVIETELNLHSKEGEQRSCYAFVKNITDGESLYIFVPVSTEYFQITKQLLEINSEFSELYSELYKKNKIIEQQKQDYYMLSVTDSLTKLFNRRYFYDIIDEEVNTYRPLSFLMIDINDFKEVNDRCGHYAGDQLLVTVADMLLANSSEEEKAFRFGGDEFLVILHRSQEEALKWAGYINSLFRTFTSIATLSYGAVEFTGENDNISQLLNMADKHMYTYKKNVKKSRQEGGRPK
ncbi:sensor domain-containing diguanylate cyclase [Salimicrobium sp. PL1-032A]|uniref:sensor domain-containing diguanylate cyclase n=1 Tax=Salimicrobium sp. PL1-032A TaxID=3095364 RepID=UPI003261386E